MKLTVLLTTYDHEPFIAQAIESVLAQAADFPFELVVLEDCSRDRTREIVLAYQHRHPRRMRVVLAERNQNDNAHFMRAYRESTAPYVALLDGDDWWTSPDKLQRQVDFLDAHGECAICFHNVAIVAADGTPVGRTINPTDQPRFSTLQDLLRRNFIGGCSAVLRRSFVRQLPDAFRTSPFADWALYVLLARFGSIGYLDEVLGTYRLHPGGIWSRLDTEEREKQVVTFLEHLQSDFEFAWGRVLRAEIGRRSMRLAQLCERQGQPGEARVYLAKYLAGLPRGAARLDGYGARLTLKLYAPALHRALRAIRSAVT